VEESCDFSGIMGLYRFFFIISIQESSPSTRLTITIGDFGDVDDTNLEGLANLFGEEVRGFILFI